ncbi:ABC-type multidrug transport system [Commensalibacter communis]|uniref:ATPase and permease component (MdlB) n=1 Tax=Commensalibacter communis TaxID=2972786 RepID=A0A9W4TQG3_9PROT|nr:ABC transporter ATP-binding protein [Commensalibacter communis]CAI3955593.1 ABC-type multidrug transport system [Commensalibacter communis]CAI3957768.1 ABC-type multidrug transport system [Commensalibacter communis]CAI3958088.1 ABC-type multidrug transport system [Commensalibacter communis]CAI3959282.1 ABC-type multidrug transport system [Commensalibacter communis]
MSNKNILGLIPLLKGQYSLLILTIISGIISQGATLATLAMGGWIVGKAIAGSLWQDLVTHCVCFAVIVMIVAASRWWQAHISHKLAFTLIEKLRLGIYDGIERSAPNAILGKRIGELASVATADAELMEHFYAHTVADYVGAVFIPFIALCILFTIHPLLTVTLVPFLIFVGIIPYWLGVKAHNQGKIVMDKLGELNAETVEVIQGQKDIIIFGRTKEIFNRLMTLSKALISAQSHYGRRVGMEQAMIDSATALGIICVTWVGSLLMADGLLPLSLLPLAIMLAGGALAPIVEVTQTARKLGELKAGASRILTIFHQKHQIIDKGTAPAPTETSICFDNVSFGYGNDRGNVLTQLDFMISPGETVALVGYSGAGKSTAINLLLRFCDVTEGAIRIGGRDLRDLPVAILRQLIAYVPQDIHLFNESIIDNIRLGKPEASLEEVKKASKQAQAHDFIVSFPKGYDTICGEAGSRLSGGQKQRIAIARALLMQSPILLLDEASSRLDNENEHAFQKTLSTISHRCTIILISHRVSTMQAVDRILLMDNGKIVAQGKHKELLLSQGIYAKLIASSKKTQL